MKQDSRPNHNRRPTKRARATVSIIEREPRIWKALFRVLRRTRELRAGAVYPNIELALKKMPLAPPAALLIDANPPSRTVLSGLRWLKVNLPQTRVILLTEGGEAAHVFQAFKAGADGWFLKDEPAPQLTENIQEMLRGGSPISAAAARRLIFSFQTLSGTKISQRQLSSRELEIVELLSRGLSDKEIASALRIALTTVNDHLKSVYRKLRAHSRAEAVAKFLQR